MKDLIKLVPCVAFLGAGIYLLTIGHETAGGWLLGAAVLTGWMSCQ